MASAYENIRKLNSLLRAGEPLSEQNRLELARLRALIQSQLIQAEYSEQPPLQPDAADPTMHTQPELAL